MDVMPPSMRARIPASQLAAFTHAFVAAQANRHNLFSHWSARAARFSYALQKLDDTQRQSLDEVMTRYLQEQDWVSEMARRMRFAWLIVKAYDSTATTQQFINYYKTAIEPSMRLNSMQLWQLLAARLVATGTLDGDQGKALMEADYSAMSQRWARLVLAVLASKGGSRQKVGAWKWSAWSAYVEGMIKDPKMDPARIWQVLNLRHSANGRGAYPEAAAGEVKAKTQLLDQMGRWFMEAPHLNDRQVLRQVQRCVASQRALTNGVSSRTLANVAEVITRDLEKGGRGRTSRMRWLVGMVEQTHGADGAKRAAKALQGWRWTIDRSRKDGA